MIKNVLFRRGQPALCQVPEATLVINKFIDMFNILNVKKIGFIAETNVLLNNIMDVICSSCW